MGIGVSYISGDVSRTFSLDGIPPEGSEAFSLLSGVQQAGAASAFLGMPGMPQMAGNGDGASADPTGSLDNGPLGFRLRGDESAADMSVYGNVGGVRGFHRIDAYDPSRGEVVLGGVSESEPNGESCRMSGSTGAVVRIGARTVMECNPAVVQDENGGGGEEGDNSLIHIVVKEFWRDATITPFGRITNISSEKSRVVGSFITMNGEGGGSCDYGARLIYRESGDPVHPIPVAIAFGKSKDLDTYDGTGNFKCNIGVDDPPVKVVGTVTCTGGRYIA